MVSDRDVNMHEQKPLSVALLPGDGIGPEVLPYAVDLIQAALAAESEPGLAFFSVEAGAGCYQRHGVAIPDEELAKSRAADAILLAAMGLPSVRYADGTEIAPQLELREQLELYAGVRPIKSRPGLPRVLSDPRAETLDFVLVRESTEGLFAARNQASDSSDKLATDTMKISRSVCERLFDFSLELALTRKAAGHPGRLTCVDKANVLSSMAFFRKIFDERTATCSDIQTDYCYVDAAGLNLVKAPWNFDVMVTENMFGDILSDVGAALVGGMGMAPSADIGDKHAVFQPCHGSAPDIAGQGIANPTAMILSGAMMLDWLGRQHDRPALVRAGERLDRAVDAAYAAGTLLPGEFGGQSNSDDIARAVADQLASH